jgi:hypothetical protein
MKKNYGAPVPRRARETLCNIRIQSPAPEASKGPIELCAHNQKDWYNLPKKKSKN